ncbi:hypothetical protein CRUP_014312 [Coryphaenoides rupestris]|nr:hypothetical protein CRUP_014312 [Coryphaenoides rupestris]
MCNAAVRIELMPPWDDLHISHNQRGPPAGEITAAAAASGLMDLSKRVSVWSVEEVSEWVQQQQYSGQQSMLQTAILQHAVSGRALLRMTAHHLEELGVGGPAQQEVLQDVLLLRVQEELENLMEIFTECFSS